MKYQFSSFSFWRRMFLFGGLLLIIFGAICFSHFPAKTQAGQNRAEQNLVNGRLAFSRRDLPNPAGYIVTSNPDGSGRTSLTATSTQPTLPAWSPDGTKIAFNSAPGNGEIYVMDANGSGLTNLTNTAASETNSSWSVNGKIAYERREGGTGGIPQIWTMNADGSGQVQFPGITQPSPTGPAWSPNGTKLAFSSGGEIWVIDANGTNEVRLTMTASTDTDPAWSPDGLKIVFVKGGSGITVMNADGSNETPLAGGGAGPAWSPDGTKIAYRGTSGIWTMDVSGTSQARIVTDVILFPQCCDSIFENPAWQPVAQPQRAQFDFDGDGRTDVSVFRPSDGRWYLLRSAVGFTAPQWGISSDLLAPADYDGDLKTDIVVWRPSNGYFYVLNSFDNSTRIENFGLMGDIPTGGDWDGDGKADVAVYREGGAQQGFHYRGSMGNPNGNVTSIPWGAPGDKPVAGDYDGDRRTDAAVFRPSTGTWYVRNSSNGGLTAVNFGLANDKLVPADYDGDGKTDFAIFRDGFWYLMRSAQGFTGFQFGTSNDIPASADYDGDGRADAAIYRDGVWWILYSQSGAAQAVQFGQIGDVPIPSAYVR